MDNLALKEWDMIENMYPEKAPKSNIMPRGYSERSVIGSAAPKLNPQRKSKISEQEKKRREQEEQRKHRAELIKKYKQKERSVSRKRLKESLAVIMAVVVISGMFAFVLFRQAQIASLNFQNNAVTKKIDAIRQETAQIKEGMILETDLDMIRSEACERLGMQKPGTSQIVSVSVGNGDKLITGNSYNMFEISPAALAQAKEDLAKYYLNED